jgi:hypothetical protein
MICSFVLTAINELSIVRFSNSVYNYTIYTLPWTRIAAYQVGVIFGMMYFEYKLRNTNVMIGSSWPCTFFLTVKHNRPLRYILLVLGIVIHIVLIALLQVDFRLRKDPLFASGYFPQTFNNFYNAVCRPLFVT